MPEKSTDFRAAIQRLAEAQVRYVLIGGLAMIVRGASHITIDIDICYDRTNVLSLVDLLKQHHARLRGVPPDLPFILDARTFKNTLNLTLEPDISNLKSLFTRGLPSFQACPPRHALSVFSRPDRSATVENTPAPVFDDELVVREIRRPHTPLEELNALLKLHHSGNRFGPHPALTRPTVGSEDELSAPRGSRLRASRACNGRAYECFWC